MDFLVLKKKTLGFSGPFLMTQGQGEWSSKALSHLALIYKGTQEELDLEDFTSSQTSYNSHLKQVLENEKLKIEQNLFFNSPHSAIITTKITNLSNEIVTLQPDWHGTAFSTGLQITKEENTISLKTDRSTAKGIIQVFESDINNIITSDSSYSISLKDIKLEVDETTTLTLAHTFIFPEYKAVLEQQELELSAKNPQRQLQKRIEEKTKQLSALNNKLDTNWQDSIYKDLVTKNRSDFTKQY